MSISTIKNITRVGRQQSRESPLVFFEGGILSLGKNSSQFSMQLKKAHVIVAPTSNYFIYIIMIHSEF